MIWLAYLSAYSSVIPFVYGIIKFNKADSLFRIAICYFTLVFLTEVATSTMNLVNINNAVVSNIFYLLEGAILIIYILQLNKIKNPIILIAVLIYFTIWLFYNHKSDQLNVYNSEFRALESIIIQLLSGFTLYRQGIISAVPIFKNQHFTFLFGVFLYFGANIILFYLTNILIDIDKGFAINMWAIHSIINIITIIIFTFSIYLIAPKTYHDWRS